MDAWPPSLRAFVSRAFAAADALDSGSDHHSRREAERFLRDRIAQAVKSSTLTSVDWDREPMPAFLLSLPALQRQQQATPVVAQAQVQVQVQLHGGNNWNNYPYGNGNGNGNGMNSLSVAQTGMGPNLNNANVADGTAGAGAGGNFAYQYAYAQQQQQQQAQQHPQQHLQAVPQQQHHQGLGVAHTQPQFQPQAQLSADSLPPAFQVYVRKVTELSREFGPEVERAVDLQLEQLMRETLDGGDTMFRRDWANYPLPASLQRAMDGRTSRQRQRFGGYGEHEPGFAAPGQPAQAPWNNNRDDTPYELEDDTGDGEDFISLGEPAHSRKRDWAGRGTLDPRRFEGLTKKQKKKLLRQERQLLENKRRKLGQSSDLSAVAGRGRGRGAAPGRGLASQLDTRPGVQSFSAGGGRGAGAASTPGNAGVEAASVAGRGRAVRGRGLLSTEALAERRARFQVTSEQKQVGRKRQASLRQQQEWNAQVAAAEEADVELDWDALTVKGTSQALEKAYLRLTSAPAPSDVRPEAVLMKSLEHIARKYNSGKTEYLWLWEQFKSIRQDLRVQHIRNPFTCKVYEINSRFAIREGDLGEFNQCKTQLEALYDDPLMPRSERAAEMVAYWIIYHCFTDNAMGNGKLMLRLPPRLLSLGDRMRYPVSDAELQATCVEDTGRSVLVCADNERQSILHALCLRRAKALGHYRRFFQLVREAPSYTDQLVKHFLDAERTAALGKLAGCYGRTHVPVSFVAEELGFFTEEDDGSERLDLSLALAFLEESRAVLVGSESSNEEELVLDCAKTAARLR